MDDLLAITRGLLPYAIRRNQTQTIELLFDVDQAINPDGSIYRKKCKVTTTARVVELTTNEIQRLTESGITLSQGYSVSVAKQFKAAPAKIKIRDCIFLTPVKFTQDQGASVWVCDMPSLGHAIEPGDYPDYCEDPYLVVGCDPSAVGA